MTALIAPTAPAVSAVDVEALVRRACLRVPPLWPLDDLVAVNPYLGYVDGDALAADATLQRRAGVAALPGWPTLQRAWAAAEFGEADLAAACAELAQRMPVATTPAAVRTRLELPGAHPPAAPCARSIAAVLAARGGVDWLVAVVEDIGRFLAARADRGIGRWRLPVVEGLYAAWRAWMRHDRSMAARGLHGMRAFVAALPADAAQARDELLARLDLGEAATEDYLARLLADLPGWAGMLRQEAWQQAHDAVGELPELLAIRLAYDLALRALAAPRGVAPQLPDPGVDDALERDRAARLVALSAWEAAWRRAVVARLRFGAAAPARPAAQAVFCIDVRSEPMRRHLEAVSPAIETYGFAGFFAMPVAAERDGALRAQCPVLLPPAHRVGVGARPAAALRPLIGAFRRSAAGGFAYMETAGLLTAAPLVAQALGLGGARADRGAEDAELELARIPIAARAALLAGMLANLGLAKPYARLVLLCGHDSSVANNPQGAALACGACGGHSGALNARLAARLYNDAALRVLLGAEAPPADSVAVAAVHDTATDEVRILDARLVPPDHAADLASLRAALADAGARLRAQRAPALPGLLRARGAGALLRRLLGRSRDWAELRPEWGLADNACFIAAPRALTRGVDLGGRCFLHSYDEERDPRGEVLALILTAPVVVASWINLQYYASTVDPAGLGSGCKTIHTIVGGIGVASGADGDLRAGLALQSVHDGQRERHRPLRLQVFVAAARERIDAVVAGHAHLRDLVANAWIGLHAIDAGRGVCWRRAPDGWREMDATVRWTPS